MRITHAIWATLLVWLLPNFAMAESFYCISNNSYCAAAQNLSWSLSGNSLTITNHGAKDASAFVSSVYFDYGSDVRVIGVTGWTGSAVSFRKAETIGENILPSGLPVGFVSDVSWTAAGDSDASKQLNSVNGGESITFDLVGVSAKNLSDGKVRVGVHLQGIPGAAGASASISLVTAVTQAGTYAMLLAGLAGSLGLVGAVVVRRHGSSASHA